MTRWDEQQVLCPPLVHRRDKTGNLTPDTFSAPDYLHIARMTLQKWKGEANSVSDLDIQELQSLVDWRDRRVQEIALDIQSRPEFLDIEARGGCDEPGMSLEEADRYLMEHCL